MVGSATRDDAAVYDIGHGMGLISTTDFFMPIVDDPATFGRIAAANAISDVYAMGGRPVLAIGILGWPVKKIPASVAGEVLEGARALCFEAGIAIGGGHSIDNPEPLFGLAVNGLVRLDHLKRNDTGSAGDLLFLTKPLGIGLLTTAEKKGLVRDEDVGLAARVMTQLNSVGTALAEIEGVTAMTDVTGFGLVGHLVEVCEGSEVAARIDFDRVPLVTDLAHYLDKGTIPGGTGRNFESYGTHVGELTTEQQAILCDPQTSGGLLIAVRPDAEAAVSAALHDAGLGAHSQPIGELVPHGSGEPRIAVR